jgi:hypothetical protein
MTVEVFETGITLMSAVLMLQPVAICSRKMRRQHFQHRLVPRLAPHGKPVWRTFGSSLVTIHLSEPRKLIV